MIKNIVLLLFFNLFVSACSTRVFTFGFNGYMEIIGKQYITESIIYKDLSSGILWQSKNGPSNIKWQTIPIGTKMVVKNIVTRVLKSGRVYYASVEYTLNNNLISADMPLNEDFIYPIKVWNETDNSYP